MGDKQPLLTSWYSESLSKIQNDCLTVLVNTLIPTGPTYIIFSCILFERLISHHPLVVLLKI